MNNVMKILKFQAAYSINVLWGGVVSSIGPVALKGEVVFGSKKGYSVSSLIT